MTRTALGPLGAHAQNTVVAFRKSVLPWVERAPNAAVPR